MSKFKIFCKKHLGLVSLGVLVSCIVSLGTFCGFGESNLALSSYLSALSKKSGKEVSIVSHSEVASGFGLPGAQSELGRQRPGISLAYAISEITDETYKEHSFACLDNTFVLNLVSYKSNSNDSSLNDCLGLNLIAGSFISQFVTEKCFYISEATAQGILNNNPALNDYEDLLQNPILYEGQSFVIQGIFSDESKQEISGTLSAILDTQNNDYTDDFIVAPYYLMNGGFFYKHNSFVLSLKGNESVFYNYLNYMSTNWKQYSVSTSYYYCKNGAYKGVNLKQMPFSFLTFTWPSFVFFIISVILLFGVLFLAQKHIKHFYKCSSNRIVPYFCLVGGMLLCSLIMRLLNGNIFGDVFLYFCNYYFVIIEIGVLILLTSFLMKSPSSNENRNFYYSIDI